jgi:hypothetical protein
MTQRKVNMAMVKNTPIRLVALDEEPPEDEVTVVQDLLPVHDTAPTPVGEISPAQDAAPLRSTPEHEAITRRVPAAPEIAKVPEWPKPTRTWRRFIPVGIAIVPAIGLSLAWLLSRPATAPEAGSAVTTVPRDQAPPLPPPTATPLPMPSLPPVAPARGSNPPELIRLQISAEPAQAELGLDGNVLAGHRLNLQVPKDRGIHVVSASAPGYYPFIQQVSFSNDIDLRITLRRAHGATGRQGSRARPSPVEAQAPVVAGKPTLPAPSQAEPKAQSSAKAHTLPRLEPGMDLDTPAPRHGAKSIDERNPYRP